MYVVVGCLSWKILRSQEMSSAILVTTFFSLKGASNNAKKNGLFLASGERSCVLVFSPPHLDSPLTLTFNGPRAAVQTTVPPPGRGFCVFIPPNPKHLFIAKKQPHPGGKRRPPYIHLRPVPLTCFCIDTGVCEAYFVLFGRRHACFQTYIHPLGSNAGT